MVAERGGEQQEGVIGDVRPSARGWATLRDSRSWAPGQRKAGCVLPFGERHGVLASSGESMPSALDVCPGPFALRLLFGSSSRSQRYLGLYTAWGGAVLHLFGLWLLTCFALWASLLCLTGVCFLVTYLGIFGWLCDGTVGRGSTLLQVDLRLFGDWTR